MFRGKEFSNRIEISQLVRDLLNFGVLGFNFKKFKNLNLKNVD